jgi:uncharacterized membrane protein
MQVIADRFHGGLCHFWQTHPWCCRKCVPSCCRRTCGGHSEATGVLGSGVVKQGASRVGSFRGAETHTRSVLKAISWRTLGTLDTFAISWFMTGRVEIAGSIAGLEVATKIAWYYLHERVWAAIQWGRR